MNNQREMSKEFFTTIPLERKFIIDLSEGSLYKCVALIIRKADDEDDFVAYVVDECGCCFKLQDNYCLADSVIRETMCFDTIKKWCEHERDMSIEEYCGFIGCPIITKKR